jgi:hypothetical protein
VIGTPVDLIDWPRLEPFLHHFAARSRGMTTVDGLTTEIKAKMRQVWVCGDWQAVVLTQVHPDCVTMNFCAGFRREDWMDTVDPVLCAWARSLGKSHVRALARAGWSRAAKARGWRETHREYTKEIV